MIAGWFLTNALKSHLTIHTLLQRHTIKSSNVSTRASLFRNTHNQGRHDHQQQQSEAVTRIPHFIYRRTKELDLSAPTILPSVSSSGTASSSVLKIGFVGWYLGMLKSRPIITKSVSCAFIYTAADLSSQYTVTKPSSEPYDLVRTLRMTGYGLLILGPSLHFWYNFLSNILPKRDLVMTFKKIALGQAIYGPTMISVFFSVNAALQGENSVEIIARLKRDLLPTMQSAAMYWPICEFILFKFVPVHLQPLTSNSFSYLWTIYTTYMASLEKVTVES